MTGTVEAEKFTVEKLHFQSRPGLYVTANLYVPKPAPKKAPAILYVCGHGNVVKDGVSYGSKVYYQRHPAWFASHGYVCLILDTLQLGEVPGEHHGTYRKNWWWWQSRGYTPGGVELWNAMRTLDYLGTRPEVDAKKIGVTGRSGGGATSWWVAAGDDRPACFVPVAGIADLRSHLSEGYPGRLETGVVAGHCDCMFMVNTSRWDFPQVAALAAPRPTLLGNSDIDDIFPVPGYRRIAEKVRKVYDALGAKDHFDLIETKGKHEDTPELRVAAFKWMNRWLKDDTSQVEDDEVETLAPEKLKVFDKLPADAINDKIAESFVPTAKIEMPMTAPEVEVWWPKKREELVAGLKEKVFAGWPAKPPDLKPKAIDEVVSDGLRLRGWDFTSEAGVELRVWLLKAEKTEKPSLVVLNVLDDAGFAEWCGELGPAFAKAHKVGEVADDADKRAESGACSRSRSGPTRRRARAASGRRAGPRRVPSRRRRSAAASR